MTTTPKRQFSWRSLPLLLLLLLPQTSNAQLFRSSSGYTKTATGYTYKGKQYIYGVHAGIPGCNCPMCRDLNAALARGLSPKEIVSTTHTLPTGTPPDAVEAMLSILSPEKGEVVYDPGCGDGRLLVEATKYGARGVGIEINRSTANRTYNALRSLPITIYYGDSTKHTIKADHVALYLFPDLISRLFPRLAASLPPGGKIISYQHALPNSTKLAINGHTFYLWTKKTRTTEQSQFSML